MDYIGGLLLILRYHLELRFRLSLCLPAKIVGLEQVGDSLACG